MKPDKNNITDTPNTASEKEDMDSSQIKPDYQNTPTIPIIGIGASAGGLEALELFLNNVPVDSGMAFVIIQHLDPNRKGLLVELLQRSTQMPVIQVTDRLLVEPDHVYIIPPNKDMSIFRGMLYLFSPAAPRGLRLPIDFFFRSLADDQMDRSIGVILSGMGTDGTLGARAIKEKAGAVFVQSPDTAQFNGMPSSAIEAGVADIVDSVEELPGKIQSYIKYIPILTDTTKSLEIKTQSALEKILILLRTQTGHDFSMYKRNTLYRRIERRMGLHQIDRIANYVRFLQENPHETQLLFKELLIGVTNFFRDPDAWDELKEKIIPDLLKTKPMGAGLRAWVAGCSTGEEAYSLAIVFKETIKKNKTFANFTLQIFATDLDKEAIDVARQGFYPNNIVADVSEERLQRFFIKEENGYRVSNEIREMIVFAPQNLIMDPPFTKLDIFVCRNLLIYFESDLQKKILPLFHFSLKPGGILFLGNAETIGGFASSFLTLDSKLRFYKRIDTDLLTPDPINFSPAFFPVVPGEMNKQEHPARTEQRMLNFPTLVDKLIIKKFAPAAVLTNKMGDILYISGRTGKYLEPAVGKANLNVFAMAREGLQYELNSAFLKSFREKIQITSKNLVVGTNGGKATINLTVYPITETSESQNLFLIVFTDVEDQSPAKTSKQKNTRTRTSSAVKELQLENARLHEDLQNSREEMQASQEELQSANEELQSTNEELQSTNEELTTSKEELQSLNEELQTVNHELQARVDELSRSNNDMKNLFNSTNIATLFLDDNLRIRSFTKQTSQLMRLIPTDVGRPITDIASDLLFPALSTDAEEVLQNLAPIEKKITTKHGNWFSVRIMPYRTADNRIDGVVITFTDITISKKLEKELRENESQMKALFKHMTNAFVLFESVFSEDGKFVDCRYVFINEAYEKIIGLKNGEVQGKTLFEIFPDKDKKTIKVYENVVLTGEPESFEIEEPQNEKRFNCNVYRPGQSQDRFCLILENISNYKE